MPAEDSERPNTQSTRIKTDQTGNPAPPDFRKGGRGFAPVPHAALFRYQCSAWENLNVNDKLKVNMHKIGRDCYINFVTH